MSLQTQGSCVMFALRRLDGGTHGGPYRLMQAGDHVETHRGWGVVRRVDARRGQMTVELFAGRPWIERQDFPEWDAARRFDRLALQHLATGSKPKDMRSAPGA